MSLKAKILEDIKTAMKAADKERLNVLRLISSSLKQVEVDERRELSDDDVLTILGKMVKQRRDSITQYEQGNRKDLADVERAEIEIIEEYLPPPMSEDELATLVDAALAENDATSLRDMGKAMATIKTKAGGRADMAAAGALVKAKLGQ